MITVCPKCNKEREVTQSILRYIKYSKHIVTCRSCASKGNKRRLGQHISEETRAKMSMASLGKPKSKEHRENMARARTGLKSPKITGEKHYLWIKDRTQLKDDHRDRGGQLHREWSRSVKNRDGWKCKMSNKDCKGNLVAHHILGWTAFPELRYDINNGITLCQAHHPRKKVEEAKLSPFFKQLVAEMK
jgi:hypothetical protein